ncbi:uncharacterized protein At2g39795, mitochondrial-like isoform X2 [Diospyros lotus]|uniref:uncharacterized protein At2g39795, mitochondrial-like isoform X2 n=1 Tax=Diospyros lotus TaxID=55363 RepID=UPI0022566C70|nr:uncharacterized protein At2g39795, mitochondrial-like isoform X2 [Diospyros lotus]
MANRLCCRPLRTILTPCVSSCSKYSNGNKAPIPLPPFVSAGNGSRSYNYISEMRKSALEGNIIRLLRNEIQYELDRSPSTSLHVPEFNSFTVDERPCEQWIRLSRKFGENEEIKVEVTMFDGSVPVEKPSSNVPAPTAEDDVKLHITLIVSIFKGKGEHALEFVCSAWPDCIEIQKVFTRGHHHNRMAPLPYTGPPFKELDDELQDSLYGFLEARGINDGLAAFLHEYMKNKDKAEFIRWMGTVKSFFERNTGLGHAKLQSN